MPASATGAHARARPTPPAAAPRRAAGAANARPGDRSWPAALRPRNARVLTGSATCGTAPAATSASQTNSQPVQASTATCTSRPAKRCPQRSTAAGMASIRPRPTSPHPISSASTVICPLCTSNPATIAIGASSKAPALPPRAKHPAPSEGGPSSCHLCANRAARQLDRTRIEHCRLEARAILELAGECGSRTRERGA